MTQTGCKFTRVLQELKSCNYGNVSLVSEVSKEEQKLQMEISDLKAPFITTQSKKLYLECLNDDMSTWTTVEQADKELKECKNARKKVKDTLEEEKEKLNKILQRVEQEHSLLQQKIPKLEEKLKLFETKKGLFEARWKLKPDEAKAGIEKCKQAISRLESEVVRTKTEVKNLHDQISKLKNHVHPKKTNNDDQNRKIWISRMKEVLNLMETMSDIRVTPLGPEQIHVTFLTVPEQSILADVESLNLEMTLTFNFTDNLATRLTDVKVTFGESNYINVDHFNIKDIIDNAIAQNDVPYLILTSGERWNKHYPMLTEMDVLTKHHAIDWIPEKGQLRILVGKGGNIMFSLGVPKDYPASRDITLLDSHGITDIDRESLPASGSTLLQWVLHFEDKYGQL